MKSRIRRVRAGASIKKQSKAPSRAQMSEQQDRLNTIANYQNQIADIQRRLAEEERKLFMFMTDNGIDHMNGDSCFADIKQSSGKSQNLIDPKKLRDLLPKDKDYYSCLSVSVTRARELLGVKELDKITTTIPAVPGPRKLVVKVIDSKE